MRNLVLTLLLLYTLFFTPQLIYGQAPNLGTTADFALFTTVGAFSNVGATTVNGDIGTNVGAFTGFPPGVVNGQIHVADVVSAQAAIDVDVAYGSLSAVNCGLVLGTTLGNGQILTPNVYCLGAASTLNGDLILDGGCNPNAIFIIKVNGALSTNTLSRVILTNSAALCNVYWQINGAVHLGEGSVFRGTILANGAISILEGATLLGRGLSRQGAIDLHNNVVDFDLQPTASVITAGGATTFCIGGSVTLSGNCGGVWSNGATTPTITVTTSGTFSVLNSNSCGNATSNQIVVTVNPLPICTITGDNSICQGQTTQLCVPPGAASYLWSTGATTNCITVGAGIYSVTVTDLNGCSSICSETVTVNPLPICTITGDNSICQGQTTQLCVPPGAASYLWSTGATTNCITVGAGIYSVTVTDVNGCSSICSETVTVNPLPICTITGDNSICQGQTTQLCVPPGAASYLWSTGATTNCITVGAGIYSVTVTDLNGCSSICSETVTVNPLPICTITGDNSICQGQTTQLCVPSGAASYLWSTGATTNCISVGAGIYSVTVTDVNGCSSICSETVTVNPLPICTITGDNSICQGQTTQLCVPPGAASYLWSTGATTNCIIVGAGIYSVTVTDLNGCSSICSETVTVNPAPICTITGNNFICTAGQTTQLCVPPGAASYLWSTGATTNCIIVGAGIYLVTVTDVNGCSSICSETVTVDPAPICTITGNNFICNTGQTTQLCVPPGAASYLWSTGATTNCIIVGAGIYSVTVTDLNGCSSICSETVTVNPLPICTITGNNFICTTGQTTQLCVPPGAASYLWSTGATTNCIIVGAGIYSVTVTDANGCSSICSETVTVNPAPICTITGNNFICTAGQTTQLCVPPGTASYLWSTGATTNCISVGAGIYSVTVTDLNGCSSICSETVTVDSAPICTITGNDFICTAGQTTQLCVPPGAASYLWSTGATTNCISVGAGIYSVTVTDVNGCSSICSETVTVDPAPICTITGNDFICTAGQTTQLCVPPGAASYLWSTGATTNCISVGAGIYSVTVTDLNGCSSICSETVTVDSAPICTITGNDFICTAGQTTQLCVPPGAASYLWSTGATTNCISVGAGIYSVTVTDLNGCSSICSETVTVDPAPICTTTGNNFICTAGQTTQLCVPPGAASYLWSTGATTNCITVGAGIYSVTVTDLNGCSSICSETVTVDPAPICTITGNNFICTAGQTTQLCVPPGAASYLWSTGATTNCISVGAGIYSVTVTDLNGCSSICSETVTVDPAPICTITGNNIICNTAQTTQLCVPPGAASYLWSTGATTNCIIVGAGIYSVTVTDLNGCSSICSETVTVNPAPICTITGDNSICQGQTTQLCVPPGAASYLWSTGATTNCILVSVGGAYAVTITDINGCSSICGETVAVNPLPNCEITGNNFICNTGQTTQLCVPPGAASYLWSTGATTNCILVSVGGAYAVTITDINGCSSICGETVAVNPLSNCEITGNNFICIIGQTTQLCVPSGAASYLWSTGATTNCITVGAGIYSVTITDINGCSSICSETVTVNPSPICEITGNCTIPCDGQPTLLCVPPGAASYLWSTGATTNCITVGVGTYSVTVTYQNGCTSICCKTITVSPVVNCEITGNCTIPCGGQPILLCAPAGCATYLWSTGATTSCIWVSTAGNYCVTVTHLNGCSSVCSKIVTFEQVANCEITGNCIIPCGGQPIQLCAPAGCATYLWSTGATTSCIWVSTAGNYCVTVTHLNGCTSVCSKIVTSEQVVNCEITGNCTLPCSGQPTLLCAPSGAASYLWSTGATTSCIIASTAGSYCVTITHLNGCSNNSCVTVTQGYIQPCVITGDAALCDDVPTLLCAPNGFANYWWSTGATTSCIIADLPGNYAVTVTNANGCTSTDTIAVSADAICIITGNLQLVQGQSTVLCGPPDMVSYQWSTGDTTQCATVNVSGIYSVTIVNAGGCVSSCSVNVLNYTVGTLNPDSLPYNSGNLEVTTYPNPFNNTSTIEFVNPESSSHVLIEVCKLNGNKISILFDRDIEQGKIYTTQFEAENLSDGVYICRIINGNQMINKKLVLIR